jgi:cytochrome c-type biogenesis protein CcmH
VIELVVVVAAITVAVLAALISPLLRAPKGVAKRADFDLAVYRDQLREVDRDLARGLIAEREAQAARTEIQRRILSTDRPDDVATPAPHSGRSPRLALAVASVVVLGSAGLYARLGTPGLPDAPFAARAAQAAPSEAASHGVDMKTAAERLEQKLAANPDNAEGWLLYARTVSSLGDWPKATAAYRRAIALGQRHGDVYAGYGEMLVMAADGIVSPDAHAAFASALEADPKHEVARYYLALADGQAGEVERAIAAWLALAADLPENSPIRDEISRRVAEAARAKGLPVPALPKGQPPLPDETASNTAGPTAEQLQQAAQMPDAEREKMVGSMIARLAARLAAKPDDLEGWLSLGRAYAVQGQTELAVDAFDHADRLKPGDSNIKLQMISALLSNLKPADPLPQRAVVLLRQVAELTPKAPEVLWYLGVVAAREGRAWEAKKNWTELLSVLTKDGEDYAMVQTALKGLPSP